jgi:MFS family permease
VADDASTRSLWRNATFTRVWFVGLLAGVVRWLELLALGIYAFDTTGSPTLVALLVVLRFLPLVVFGLVMGALSDLLRPERVLQAGLLLVGGTALTMLALFHWTTPGYVVIAVATFVSGMFWAGDMPVRRRMLGDVVDPPRLPRAMALDSAANNATRMMGPLLGGTIYQLMGAEGVYACGVVLYGAAIAVAAGLRTPAPSPAAAAAARARLARPLAPVREAVVHALADRDIVRILLVTIVFNVWAFPYTTMVPVIGRDELGLAAGTLGLVASLEGLFALVGALLIARFRGRIAQRRLYVGAVFCLLASVLTIGVVTGLWILALGLAVGGLCASGFAAMQATLIYRLAPEALRGRLMGLLTICIGAGVLGFANVGLTAEFVGASNALWIIALEGLVVLTLVVRGWPELWRSEPATAEDTVPPPEMERGTP